MAKNGFLMLSDGGANQGVLACERCGEIITDYRMAGVVWEREDEPRSPVTILCKTNDCLNTDQPWMPLGDFFVWVAINTGLNTEVKLREAWERARSREH